MRIRFPDDADKKETAARIKTVRAIDAFWKALHGKADALDALFHNKKRWDLPAFMKQKLGAVDRRLMWEFGPGVVKKSGHRLVITPESVHSLSPLRDLLLSRAPKVPRFEFHPHRVPESLAMVGPTVEARLGHALPAMRVVVTAGEHATIDLAFLVDGCTGEEDGDAASTAFVVAQTLLGEEALERDIGMITVAPLRKTRSAVELAKLHATVKKALAARDSKRPKKSSASDIDAEYSVFQLEPEKDAFGGQDDMLVGVTSRTDIVGAVRSAIPFYSERYSRHGETFAYVKIDGSKGLGGSAYDDRGDIEDAITKALGKTGSVIGGGTGVRYSYVDLAFLDADAAIARIRAELSRGKIPKRSWILFHDATLADEWIPIYPGGPRPPR